MSKFCMQCGKEIEDDANICVYCGASQDGSGSSVGADVKKKSNVWVPLVAAAAVVLLVLIIIFNLIFGAGYKKPIDNMMKSIETGKGKYLYKSMPEFLVEYRYDDDKKDEIYDALDESMEYVVEMLEDEYGDDIKVSYKIKDKEKIKKKDLEKLEENIEDTYDEKVKVSKGYEVKIKIKIKGDDDKDEDTTTINVYKIDGDWCLMDSIF
ncbi:zinc ribbon domain-containing protein [Porcipelethomonas sp.]|uniref:zinc ribbon domain-containing protein n=1 Tax=Porcipelethomonas sp. TaxID=2981675 RepID=UPI003EF9C7EA